MKKYKYSTFTIVALIVITLFSFQLKSYALTQEEIDAYLAEKDKTCNIANLSDKYKVKMEKVAGTTNQFKIYLEGAAENLEGAEFKIGEIQKGTLVSDATILEQRFNKDTPLYVNINTVQDFKHAEDGDDYVVDTAEKIVQLKVVMTSEKDECLGLNDEHYQGDAATYKYKGMFWTVVSYKSSGVPLRGSISDGATTEANINIGEGKACTNFINGYFEKNQFDSADNVVIKEDDFTAYNYAAVNDEGKQFYRELLGYCWRTEVTKGTNYTEKEITNMIADAITTWKAYSTSSTPMTQTFEQAFTDIYNNAVSQGNAMGLTDTKTYDYKSSPNYCDWKKIDTTTDYYVNKDYYYTKQSEGVQKATYTYNYAPGDTQSETVDVCERICEEAVKVEYGPPQATKAGLCFEYNVKVTSYAKCTSTTPQNPPQEKTYCLPAPLCYNVNVGWLRQAGPTESFESCIQDCDGGKYTQACSLSCYKKVYKNNSSKLKLSYQQRLQAQQLSYSLDTCKSDNSDGCYYWSGSEIKWSAGTHDYGRWYYDTNYNISDPKYKACDNGIKRSIKADGSLCKDECHWTGCGTGEYLNLATASKDYAQNLEEYKAAVNKCRAAAACSKKTATFSISVKYDTKDEAGNVTVNQIFFPYTSDSQHITNPSGGEYSSAAKDRFTDGVGSKNDKNTIISYDGCYSNEDQKRWYLTEWGFPGTYRNYKEGDILYQEPTDTSGWEVKSKEFCTQLNSQNVNEYWWYWKSIDATEVTDSQIESELNSTNNSNGYNIEAVVENFGYFGWDFKIKCFYAQGKQPLCPPSDPNYPCPPDDCPPSDPDYPCPPDEDPGRDYELRIIDRGNVFPNSVVTIPEEQRRLIGFNWTENSIIPSSKGGTESKYWGYSPIDYVERIESTAETLYSEDPDYEFYLTPTELRALREYNDKYSYTTWNGETKLTSIENEEIYTYYSNLFRNDVGIERNIITFKHIGTPGINNE